MLPAAGLGGGGGGQPLDRRAAVHAPGEARWQSLLQCYV